VLAGVAGPAHDFADLAAHWGNGIEVLMSRATLETPGAQREHDHQRIEPALAGDRTDHGQVRRARRRADAERHRFLAVTEAAPLGGTPRVRFDRGRVAVADRSGRTLLDLGGFAAGAVAQIRHPPVSFPGSGSSHSLATVRCQRRQSCVSIAAMSPFVDRAGVALAMSTERDTLVQVTYPDQVSWLVGRRAFPRLDPRWIVAACDRGVRAGPANACSAAASALPVNSVMALSPSDRALGDLLVERQILTLAQHDEAVALAESWNVRLGDAILSRNWIEPAAYYQGIAYYYELPFVDLMREPAGRVRCCTPQRRTPMRAR